MKKRLHNIFGGLAAMGYVVGFIVCLFAMKAALVIAAISSALMFLYFATNNRHGSDIVDGIPR